MIGRSVFFLRLVLVALSGWAAALPAPDRVAQDQEGDDRQRREDPRPDGGGLAQIPIPPLILIAVAIATDFTPMSDHRGSAPYRSLVAANLLPLGLVLMGLGFMFMVEAAGIVAGGAPSSSIVAPRVSTSALSSGNNLPMNSA